MHHLVENQNQIDCASPAGLKTGLMLLLGVGTLDGGVVKIYTVFVFPPDTVSVVCPVGP